MPISKFFDVAVLKNFDVVETDSFQAGGLGKCFRRTGVFGHPAFAGVGGLRENTHPIYPGRQVAQGMGCRGKLATRAGTRSASEN
ncbi:hypothetical protein [Microbulbifer sp.]|uniref:hypothetical protein n=1 Tax=Microbulbifer sp. TaxID=1908541 RepID=UPI00258904C8|nr:hypothetical protein [Microbulbifer sp.]